MQKKEIIVARPMKILLLYIKFINIIGVKYNDNIAVLLKITFEIRKFVCIELKWAGYL